MATQLGWHYVGRILVPTAPSLSDAWPIASSLGSRDMLALVAFLAILAAIVVGMVRRWMIAPPLLWYLIWYFPASGLLPRLAYLRMS